MTDSIDNHAGAQLRIDLAALKSNWQALDQQSGNAECGAAVKADAYGTGLSQAGQALAQAGCRTFFVSQAQEGAALRPHVGDARIYVLNGPLQAALPLYQEHDLRPVLNCMDAITLWRASGLPQATALHLDTGMARLGLSPDEVSLLASDNSWQNGIKLDLVMSHLAAADISRAASNDVQNSQFAMMRRKLALEEVPASLANTAGIFLGRDYHYDLVRPGIGLYGAGLAHICDNPLSQVVDLSAQIIQIRTVEAGQTIGYGGAFVAKRKSLIATVPVGYADGYPRALSHVGRAAIDEHVVPVVGRISMDLLTLDITDLPDRLATIGRKVTLIGGTIGIDELARVAGTVSYEMLTNLSRRVPRLYRA